MKAIVYTKYGTPDVLQLREIDKPTPKDHQVLIKVRATSGNALDYRRFESLSPIGRFMDSVLLKSINTVLGADVAGQVEAVGTSVTQFKPGDEVYGICNGAFAEYVCTSEKNVALKPANLSFEEAAAVPVAALTAVQSLRDKGHVHAGQKVLIVGASGGVGTFAVQVAKSFGAEVTAVCSTRNVDMVRKIGADYIIDYTKEDFAKNGQRYDVIAAINGSHSIQDYRRSLAPGGIYVAVGGSISQVIQGLLLGPLMSKFGTRKMGFMGITKVNQPDLVFMSELLAAGKVVPVIDRCYPLSETVAAVRYLLDDHAKGKVVITIEYNN